jgi:hypothetical protein
MPTQKDSIDAILQQKIFNERYYQFQKVFQPNLQDSPIIELVSDQRDGNLDHEPEYQRNFVWNDEKQSRYIESIMYGIDTPIIYFIESQREVNGNIKLMKEVIDGRQRLSTIFRFYNNELKLTSLKQKTPHYEDLNNQTFKTIPTKYQNLFKSYSIRTVTFKLVGTDVDIDTQLKFKYQLFYRYNSGLTALNQQEIRNCMYHNDKYLIMFKEIARSEIYLNVCPYFEDEARMADTEFVSLLYFLTTFEDGIKIYSKKWKNHFINTGYERIKSNIYSFESYYDTSDEIGLQEGDEQEEEDIDEDSETENFFTCTKKEIFKILNIIDLIYGKHFSGNRQERYIVESLYYNIFHKRKYLTNKYLEKHAVNIGKTLSQAINNKNNILDGKEFSLWDSITERVQDTERVLYRFEKIGEIIDNFIRDNK